MLKDTVTYEDFTKLDIRTGTIMTIDPVPKSKKLIKMEVSFGPEIGNKTILAGVLKDFLGGRILLGQKVVAVLNLEPRDMMGILSYGMLLAVHDESHQVWLLSPGGPVPDGVDVG